jgi:hypothetical protein
MVQPDKVVKLIAGHMEGKEVLVSPVETHKLSLKDINENLKDRKNKRSQWSKTSKETTPFNNMGRFIGMII